VLFASFAGYLVAASALRPVERLGERAATISAAVRAVGFRSRKPMTRSQRLGGG